MLYHQPSKEQPPASPARPTQEQMAELYDAFDINQQDLQDGNATASKLEFVADIRVNMLLKPGILLPVLYHLSGHAWEKAQFNGHSRHMHGDVSRMHVAACK